jgi:hypothetical protein
MTIKHLIKKINYIFYKMLRCDMKIAKIENPCNATLVFAIIYNYSCEIGGNWDHGPV